jgi:aminoglycoside phosphotransferase (APT) family kinase protein
VTENPLLRSYLTAAGVASGREGQADATLRRGQFHDVVLIGDMAYRFPRDEESRRLLPSRVAVLRLLGACPMPVAVPGLRSDAAVGWPLGRCHAVLQRVPGEPIEPDQLAGPAATAAAIADLAELLDQLAALGSDAAVRRAVPPADPRSWQRFADDVSGVLFPLMSAEGRARAQGELSRVQALDPAGEALVHGDLGGTNLLWTLAEPGPRLTGILDWDEAHIGSQADDLASLAVTLGWPLATKLDARRHHGRTPTVAAARAIAATFALQQALPAALSEDKEALDDGLSGYRES